MWTGGQAALGRTEAGFHFRQGGSRRCWGVLLEPCFLTVSFLPSEGGCSYALGARDRKTKMLPLGLAQSSLCVQEMSRSGLWGGGGWGGGGWGGGGWIGGGWVADLSQGSG